MPDVVEINAATGEVVERDFTHDERVQRAKDKAEAKARDDEDRAERQAKRAVKQAAKDKLRALGLTVDEVAALAGE